MKFKVGEARRYCQHNTVSNLWAHACACLLLRTVVLFLVTLLFSNVGHTASPVSVFRCHYTKSNPTDDHSNISSKKVTEAEFQTVGPLYLHAVCGTSHLTNSPRKHTVTYHFSDLQKVYSGNRQIHTKCQLQYLHPSHIYINKWQMSLCNNSSKKSYWIHRVDVKVSAQVTTFTYMHQSQPSLHSLRIHLQCHLQRMV